MDGHRTRKSYVVYALCDDTGIRYIGHCRRPKRRLKEHLTTLTKASAAMKKWLLGMRESGHPIKFRILERGREPTRRHSEWREKFWIGVYSVVLRAQLLNVHYRADFLDIREFTREAAWRKYKYQELNFVPRKPRKRVNSPDMPLLDGRIATAAAWARRLGISPQAMYLRLKRMTPEKAVTAPVTGPHRKALAS